VGAGAGKDVTDPGTAGVPGPRLRVAGPGDAAALLRLKQRLDQETSFMLLEASERDASVPSLAQELEGMARSGNSAVIVAGPAAPKTCGQRGGLLGYGPAGGRTR